MQPLTGRRINSSFSLIEVLVTLAILSSAIIFIFRSFTYSLFAARLSQDITLACYLAEEKVSELENTAAPEKNSAGTQEVQMRPFGWSYEISDASSPGLKKLTLNIYWKEPQRKSKSDLEIVTYLR